MAVSLMVMNPMVEKSVKNHQLNKHNETVCVCQLSTIFPTVFHPTLVSRTVREYEDGGEGKVILGHKGGESIWRSWDPWCVLGYPGTELIGSMGYFLTYKWAMNRAVITHFLTIDPNFLGHPRVISVCACPFGMMDTLPETNIQSMSMSQSNSLNCLLSCLQSKSKVRVPGKHRISYQFC